MKRSARIPSLSHTTPPRAWRGQMDHVLIPPVRIAAGVRRLARAIEADYAGRDLVIVG